MADPDAPGEIDGIPFVGGLRNVPQVVARYKADTVAVLACPEMSGVRLRELAWELEKTGTDLCVAPALLDVAGPRTTIRPVAGLPLLHMDHPEFTGTKQVIKDAFDKLVGLSALALTAPVFLFVTLIIRLDDGGPAFFRQTRVGRDGRGFTVYKFRTMVMDAEKLKAELAASNDHDGVLFKMRKDPRITKVGSLAAPLVPGRAAAAAQRGARGHVAGRPAARAAGRGGQVRRLRPAPPGGQARADRPVAGQRPVRPVLGGIGPA